MINMEDLKRDLLEYDLYYLLDGVEYGDYQLSILNEGDKIIIVVYDEWGCAAYMMDKKDFLNIGTSEELEKHINSILYYNYIVHEGD